MLGLQAGLLLAQPVAVIALVGYARAAVELQNPLGGIVQKIAVVGDGNHGARVALQELFQPVHRFSIQVVGRLVEQEHVGLGQQQLTQGNAPLFTAREQPDFGVPGRQSQGVGGDFELVLGVGAGAGDDGLHIGLLGGELVKVSVFLGVGGVNLFQPGLGGIQAAHAGLHTLTHGLLGV